MIFTMPLKDMDDIANVRTTNAVNYRLLETVAGASAIAGGMNTNIAGARNAIGTSMTTIATRVH
jgi:hypothetical protein